MNKKISLHWIIDLSIIFVVFLFFIFLYLDKKNAVYNITNSMPIGIYMPIEKEIERNDIVNFCLEDEIFSNFAKENEYLKNGICKNNLQSLLKIVAGVPGDIIELKDNKINILHSERNIYCLWGEIKKYTTNNIELPSTELTSGIIPSGKILVLTNHPSSFDGRYFGLIDIDKAISMQKIL